MALAHMNLHTPGGVYGLATRFAMAAQLTVGQRLLGQHPAPQIYTLTICSAACGESQQYNQLRARTSL
jgi:hypothetical protein